jgi:hypothetical protein
VRDYKRKKYKKVKKLVIGDNYIFVGRLYIEKAGISHADFERIVKILKNNVKPEKIIEKRRQYPIDLFKKA